MMKVILKEDVKKLGSRNQVLDVSDGYGRNYLIPRGLAVEADKGNMGLLKALTEAEERKDRQASAKAEEEKRHLQGRQVTVSVSSGEAGRLFGSVTASQIAEAVEKQFGVKIDKKNVKIADAVKALGSYAFTVKLHGSVEASMTLKVEAQ